MGGRALAVFGKGYREHTRQCVHCAGNHSQYAMLAASIFFSLLKGLGKGNGWAIHSCCN